MSKGIHERELWITEASHELQKPRDFVTEIYTLLEEEDKEDRINSLPVVSYVFDTSVDYFQAWNNFPIDEEDKKVLAWIKFFGMPMFNFTLDDLHLGVRVWRRFIHKWKDDLNKRSALFSPTLVKAGVEAKMNMAVNREAFNPEFARDLYCSEPRRFITETFNKYMPRGAWYTGFTVAKADLKEPVIYIRQWAPNFAIEWNEYKQEYRQSVPLKVSDHSGNCLYFFRDDWEDFLEKIPEFWAYVEEQNWDGYWDHGRENFIESEKRGTATIMWQTGRYIWSESEQKRIEIRKGKEIDYDHRSKQIGVRETPLIKHFGNSFYVRAFVSEHNIPMISIFPNYQKKDPYHPESVSFSPNETRNFMKILPGINDSFYQLIHGYAYIGFNRFIQ